jgi:hypothetical protein
MEIVSDTSHNHAKSQPFFIFWLCTSEYKVLKLIFYKFVGYIIAYMRVSSEFFEA